MSKCYIIKLHEHWKIPKTSRCCYINMNTGKLHKRADAVTKTCTLENSTDEQMLLHKHAHWKIPQTGRCCYININTGKFHRRADAVTKTCTLENSTDEQMLLHKHAHWKIPPTSRCCYKNNRRKLSLFHYFKIRYPFVHSYDCVA